MKYVPKNTGTIDAVLWDYHSAGHVVVFMDFAKEHHLGITLCPGRDGGVAAEIHRDGVYHFDVEPYEFLVVEADGSLKNFTEDEFTAAYQKVA